MADTSIYRDLAERTSHTFYLGVIGPVRTGKSTFIKKFMEAAVIPNIRDENERARARDEMPQSAAGKTVMTTEPKFVPDEAVEIDLGDNAVMKVKMVDCVGYIVPDAMGLIEDGHARIVRHAVAGSPDAVHRSRRARNQKGHKRALDSRDSRDDRRHNRRHPERKLCRRRGTRREGAKSDRQAVRDSPELSRTGQRRRGQPRDAPRGEIPGSGRARELPRARRRGYPAHTRAHPHRIPGRRDKNKPPRLGRTPSSAPTR